MGINDSLSGFPMPAGDVTLFIAAHWQQHVRYVARHVGLGITRQVLRFIRIHHRTVAKLNLFLL